MRFPGYFCLSLVFDRCAMSPVHSPEGFKRDEWMLDGDEAGGNLCSGELAVEDSAASRCEKVGRRVARCGWYSDMNKKYTQRDLKQWERYLENISAHG